MHRRNQLSRAFLIAISSIRCGCYYKLKKIKIKSITNITDKVHLSTFNNQQGSICIPSAVFNDANEVAHHGVASALDFYNGENLMLPSFQYDPQTNLSTVISFSIDNGSKVQLAGDDEPIRITFNQV